jgi:hypothetical protein
MAVANTLAYYITATITAVKSFIVQDPAKPHGKAVELKYFLMSLLNFFFFISSQKKTFQKIFACLG